jgi:rsbT co-antagonist protein RsbR
MDSKKAAKLPEILSRNGPHLLKTWMAEHLTGSHARSGLMSESTLEEQAREFLKAFTEEAAQQPRPDDLESVQWTKTRETLAEISRTQTRLGVSPTEVATFIFSLKRPLFALFEADLAGQPEKYAKEIWSATLILDRLGLFTTEVALKSREEVISRQQTEMLELSTPVVKLWDGILALPLIGTLDSQRTQVVMESLLEEIVRSGSNIAIIDITGVPTVDTLVAQHLLKTISAARLMGAECIISGIRPQIASTIVHLGVNLGDVVTKATLADAFAVALRRSNLAVVKTAAGSQ